MRRVKRIKKRVWLMGGGLMAGLVSLACGWPELFFYRSVCSVCGLEASVSEINLRLSETGSGPAWEHWNYETNAVAAVLLEHPAIKVHAHNWRFAGGGGDRAMCAIGDGRHLTHAVHSPEVAAFLGELAKAGSTNPALHWRDRILNPKQSDQARGAILVSRIYRNGAATWPQAAEEEFRLSQLSGR
jgi:hypothetical protein